MTLTLTFWRQRHIVVTVRGPVPNTPNSRVAVGCVVTLLPTTTLYDHERPAGCWWCWYRSGDTNCCLSIAWVFDPPDDALPIDMTVPYPGDYPLGHYRVVYLRHSQVRFDHCSTPTLTWRRDCLLLIDASLGNCHCFGATVSCYWQWLGTGPVRAMPFVVDVWCQRPLLFHTLLTDPYLPAQRYCCLVVRRTPCWWTVMGRVMPTVTNDCELRRLFPTR